MERWLTQRMSAHLGATLGRADGVCANVEFPSPRRLVGDSVMAASGLEGDTDPWLPERAVWPLLEVVDEALPEPWLASLAGHLNGTAAEPDTARRARRFTSIRHLADLFDRYALHRPEMVRAWAQCIDTDGAGRNLPLDTSWQAELWRRLRDRIADPGPAERLEAASTRLREDPSLVDLPHRLSLFGLTRLPAGHLAVLRALAAGRDVHLFLLHPSPALWERVARAAERRAPTIRRSEDKTATLPTNRLLASWGHDARELQLVLASADDHVDHHHHPVESAADTLLKRIQADVRGDSQAPAAPLPGHDDARPTLDPADRSVQVHACHGRARQVEILLSLIHISEPTRPY